VSFRVCPTVFLVETAPLIPTVTCGSSSSVVASQVVAECRTRKSMLYAFQEDPAVPQRVNAGSSRVNRLGTVESPKSKEGVDRLSGKERCQTRKTHHPSIITPVRVLRSHWDGG
jgi:hypothetical protein